MKAESGSRRTGPRPRGPASGSRRMIGFERGAEPDVVLDDLSVRERQPQDRRVRVRPGRTWTIIGDEQLIDEAVGVVDDEEAPILGHAASRSTAISSRRSRPRLMTGAMSRWATVGMARCYRTSCARGVHPWSMLLGIDHLVIACADPDAAVAELEREVGLQPGGGGRHEALGTFNRLVWLGDTYLELIGVFDRAMAERVVGRCAGRASARCRRRAGDVGGRDRRPRRGRRAPERGWRRPVRAHRRRASPSGRSASSDGACRSRASSDRSGRRSSSSTTRTRAEWSPADRAARAEEIHPIGGPVRLDDPRDSR